MKLFRSHAPTRDPDRIRGVLQQFVHDISTRLGDELEAIVLYGSLARVGVLQTDHDTVNLLIVLRRVGCDLLDTIAVPVKRVEAQIPLRTMTLTREDLQSSCDVFPIKFHDMQNHHRVLFGDDVLSGLVISDEHLRLRCEQQLKNLMLRLRAIYLHCNQNAKELHDTLQDANRSFTRDMQACVYTKTGMIPADESDLVAQFGSEFELDVSVVNDVRRLEARSEQTPLGQLKKTFEAYMTLVHDAALSCDQMEARS